MALGKSPGRFRAAAFRLNIQRMTKSWTFGLYAGFSASIAALVGNIALLIAGSTQYGGVVEAIGTIAQGSPAHISRTSTAFHVLINVLSTALLTASNYAMQTLCAPTRADIDRAHANGNWLEIGIMGVHNLRHIGRRRMLLWFLLAFSSAPLHLFYNSSVFEVFASQDFDITATSAVINETTLYGSDWKMLNNKDWSRIYAAENISGYSDLHLMIDQVSFEIQVQQNWSYTLRLPTSVENCDWGSTSRQNETFNIGVGFSTDPKVLQIRPIDRTARFVASIDDFTANKTEFPGLTLPAILPGKIGNICPGTGWLQAHPALYVKHARAKINNLANRVQVAIPFLCVVIACNFIKVIGIWLTIKTYSNEHLLTGGDAIASFLNTPEPTTAGRCTLTKSQRHRYGRESEVKPWTVKNKATLFVLGGARVWTATVIFTSFILTMTALTAATANVVHATSPWGTASRLIVPFTSSNFNTRGILLVAFIANFPQVCLSLLYFSINRICTSICFATEWNNFATHRKALRVTAPVASQRGTHFLQLPLRWAIPLTTTSGVLHWLLSQSLFLVRRETRTRAGEIYGDSTCACGYSVQSILAFSLVFCVLLLVIICRLLWRMHVRMPPARHCSLVISAACHAPLDEVDPHLCEVMWGVTEEAMDDRPGHCSISAGVIGESQAGHLYI
ncbi:hypothetical protein FB567DRAFT_598307 [Paraphoma chrysanthemicola]|uniref:DUF6536 domain-containing protein n=1 Tax=Paraphoma chrysanthemicola TaxID=798071 RepID=A0A8K0VSM3_9PLEO|nr:hypothetical protein FB567DRAFT_598307 [Paraphoma chrysanthemicola]